MATATARFFSAALRKWGEMTLILPDSPPPKEGWPVLYLLHGLSDDHTIWTRRTSLERYCGALPWVVAMPDGGRGFYTDAREGPAWESHLLGDVIGFVECHFRVSPRRSHRMLAGLSMGGYGAMKIGLKYPDRFSALAAHSGVFNLDRQRRDTEDASEHAHIFGPGPLDPQDDIFALAAATPAEKTPAIYFDCGREDELGLHQDAVELHLHFEKLGIAHTFASYSGGHNWEYWDLHIRDALGFLADFLPVQDRKSATGKNNDQS